MTDGILKIIEPGGETLRPAVDYAALCTSLRALTDGVDKTVTNLANASALLFTTLPDLNWAGFYLREDDRLFLGPFQGKPACTVIPFGKGVCGTAAREDRALLVPDVHAFPGHIACDSASRSELVIPIRQNGRVVAVLDLDSPVPGRFSEEDLSGLTALVRILEETAKEGWEIR